MNIERTLQGLVALGATWVLWVLVGLSVLGLAVILERLVFMLRTRADVHELRIQLNQALERGELARIAEVLASHDSLEARVVNAGLAALRAPEAQELMAAEAQHQRLRAEQYLAFLGTLGNNAPFVGLLGTVLGIVGAFHQLDSARGQVSNGLMSAIGEALVATAVGLLVALPAVASYNAFQRTIQVRLSRADALGRELIAHLHTRRFESDDSAPASGPSLATGQ
ncbi:MAG: MotA/TolQ/ExbB proton channel family protein [Myxococcota bacterium]